MQNQGRAHDVLRLNRSHPVGRGARAPIAPLVINTLLDHSDILAADIDIAERARSLTAVIYYLLTKTAR